MNVAESFIREPTVEAYQVNDIFLNFTLTHDANRGETKAFMIDRGQMNRVAARHRSSDIRMMAQVGHERHDSAGPSEDRSDYRVVR
jgi:hypothetical protein